MSGFTLTAGQTLVASSSQIGAAQTSTLHPDGTLTIVKDENASASGATVNSVTIDTVSPDQTVSVDYGGGIEDVVTTTYGVKVNTTLFGQITGTIALLGTDDAGHVLVADAAIPAGIILSSVAQTFGTISDTFTPVFTVACFAEGTRLLTPDGEVAVEALREGQSVVLASRRSVPVTWLGHRRIDCRQQPRPQDLWPVRVRAGAFGPDVPRRDVLLSPDHAVFVPAADVLIPIRYLINGATVVQEAVDEVTYWHVELADHDVLLAEGLPVESYLDTGNRGAFANGGAAVAMHPDFSGEVWRRRGCAPLVWDGEVLAQQQARLLEQAAALGYERTNDPDLNVVCRGQTLRPRREGAALVWHLPPGTREITLQSRSTVPAWTYPGQTDHRRLGVAVWEIRLEGRVVPESSRVAGWHAAESGLQWTDGNATLAVGPGRLEVTLAMCSSYWCDAGRNDARRLA